MKIELRGIIPFPQAGDKAAFAAQLYINGRKVALVTNNKESPQTRYLTYNSSDEQLVRKAEAYCKELSPVMPGQDNKGEAGKPMDLRQFIDHLYLKYLREKELEKAMELGIVFGDPDGSYLVQGFKIPFEMLLVHPMATEVIGEVIRQRIVTELSDGKIILNTNIPENILQSAGLRPDQYLSQRPQQQQKTVKKRGRKL